jgi:hypothetical protein
MGTSSSHYVLRNLPLVPRVVIAAFLLSVGIGYFSALVQLHYQMAKPGQPLPGPEETERRYSRASQADVGKPGQRPVGKIEHLVANLDGPFDGSGSMAKAFFERSEDWKDELKERKTQATKDLPRRERSRTVDNPRRSEVEKAAEDQLRKERDGERLALLSWIRGGAPREAYEKDSYPLPDDLKGQPLTPCFLDDSKKAVKIKSLITERCAVCHGENGKDDKARDYPLDKYDQIKRYVPDKDAPPSRNALAGAMSEKKLAQTTHVHLLGFGILYGLTGLIFSFTSYPLIIRLLIAPLPLLVQVVDISCWWLARYDPMFAHLIPLTGALVAAGLFVHIAGSLFNMFGSAGKAVVLAILLAGAGGGYFLYEEVIAPKLEQEIKEAESGRKTQQPKAGPGIRGRAN